ncbi:hypothetical protein N9N67_12190 [Bacteriovoracaceae bacterium]|nr:hypothetical protein [Bacteriovoracaceae bacterium]
MTDIYKKVLQYLNEQKVQYKYLEHGPAKTCEESALMRNEPIEIGGKTILLKSKEKFHLFVLSAALSVDSKRVRKILKDQKLRFANQNELMERCQVEKGALPPFGAPIYPFDLYLDDSILTNDRIAFNAGDITKSVILKTDDYLKLVIYKQVSFSKN